MFSLCSKAFNSWLMNVVKLYRGVSSLLTSLLLGLNALWFNRGMGPKLKSFILAIFSPVCNGGSGPGIV